MPSTRGYFLGQVIDELDAIAHQVDTRAQLGLFDLNRMLEDFYKEVLNLILDLDLKNLNADHLNTPGLDLGDTKARIAFQVTSDPSAPKINDTMAKITDAQLETYDRIRVLIIGKKKSSYRLDEAQMQRTKFTAKASGTAMISAAPRPRCRSSSCRTCTE